MRRRAFGAVGFVRGALVGAGLVYWLDPISGRRRRVTTRQRLRHTVQLVRRDAGAAVRDLSHRTTGLIAHVRRRVNPQPVDDVTLKARVQARVGRATSHPGSLQVACRNGRVELAGVVLKREMAELIRAVHRVPGVEEVVNCLETRDEAAHMPGAEPSGSGHTALAPVNHAPLDGLLDQESPALRLLSAVAGLALFAHGRRRHGVVGGVSEMVGLGVFGYSLSAQTFERFSVLEGRRRGIGLRKTINVDAPVDEVFAFFRHAENFPLFMVHVHEVQRIDDRRLRWKVIGPARLAVEWDAEVTEVHPNELIAWRSVEGAAIENAGRVRFTRNEHGGTRIEIQLSYHPPGGILGHLLAMLIGASPKKLMDDDLVRLKSLFEQGKAKGRFGMITRAEIAARGQA